MAMGRLLVPSDRLFRPVHPETCSCVSCVKRRLTHWHRPAKPPSLARETGYAHKRRVPWRSAFMVAAITVGLWTVLWQPDALAEVGTASKPLVTSGFRTVVKVVKGNAALLTTGDIEAWVFEFTNDARAEAGLVPLEPDASISTIARQHSESMSVWGFGHTVQGKGPTDRALDAGYDCRTYHPDGSYTHGLSENITKYSKQHGLWLGEDVPKKMGRQLVDSWLNSPGHRENLLDVEARRLGVGVYVNDWVYATQNFSSCP